MAIPITAIVTGVTTAVPIISKIFGGKPEPRDEAAARWMAGWQRDMTPSQWAYFSQWINVRLEKQDWCEACPIALATQRSDEPRDKWLFIGRKSNDILGKSPNCRPDWQETGGIDVQALVDDQANANLAPESRVSMAGLGGMTPLLIAGGVLLALMLFKKR